MLQNKRDGSDRDFDDLELLPDLTYVRIKESLFLYESFRDGFQESAVLDEDVAGLKEVFLHHDL